MRTRTGGATTLSHFYPEYDIFDCTEVCCIATRDCIENILSSMTMRWTLDEREVHVLLSLLSGKRCDGQKKAWPPPVRERGRDLEINCSLARHGAVVYST